MQAIFRQAQLADCNAPVVLKLSWSSYHFPADLRHISRVRFVRGPLCSCLCDTHLRVAYNVIGDKYLHSLIPGVPYSPHFPAVPSALPPGVPCYMPAQCQLLLTSLDWDGM